MSGGKRAIAVGGLFLAGLAISAALQVATRPRAARARDGERSIPAAGPQRIIALAPNVTESLFALGAAEQVVAVGDFCFYPPEAKERPRVGGEFNPNFERILALRPDLLIVQGVAEKVEDFGQRYGMRILHVDMDSIETICAGLLELGRAVGREAAAERLAARLKLDLAKVAYRVAGRARPKTLLCMGHRAGSLLGLSTVNGKSFLSQALEVAGGANVFADLEQPYPPFSKETLLRRRAEAVIELHPGETISDGERQRLLADWGSLPSLPAVRDGRVYILTEDYLLLAGPRVAKTAERLAEVLHPEAR